ncbi:MAG: hypothetical protein R2781_01725 [Flavobacteriaceae bacterium]
MKHLLFFLLFGCILSLQSQKKVASIKRDFGTIKQSFNVVDDSTGNFAIFLEEGDKVTGVLYDANFNEIGSVVAPDLSSKFKSILGYQIHGNKISLLLNTLNGRSYGVYHFNFDTGDGISSELDFKVRKEKFIQAISYQNSIYILTVPLFKSQLTIYEFNNIEKPLVHEIVLNENDLLDRRDRGVKLFDLVDKRDISLIDEKNPNSLEATSKDFKVYQKGETVYLTSDKYKEFTQILNVSLKSFTIETKRILNVGIDGSKVGTQTNSFLNKDKLFQIGIDSDYLKFQVVDLNSDKVIKKIETHEDESLNFINTPIVIENADFQKYRELEKTRQFFRKIREGDIALSVFYENDTYQITLGSVSEQMGYAFYLSTNFGLIGGLIAISINPTTNSYWEYTYTKSVRVTGLFDDNFNTVEGEVPMNIFDKMNDTNTLDLLHGNENLSVTAETVFKLDNYFIKGFYIKNAQTYYLVKYDD